MSFPYYADVKRRIGTLTGGSNGDIAFAWHNRHTFDILIQKVTIEVTTAGGTAFAKLQVGIADDAKGTNLGNEFTRSTIWADCVGTYGHPTAPETCQDVDSTTDGWVVGKIVDANASNLAGTYQIEYAGK